MFRNFFVSIHVLYPAKHRPVVLDGRDEQELPDAESLLFDLVTLKEATDDFSEANKLGQGGFGPVYKVKVSAQGFSFCFFFLLLKDSFLCENVLY